MKKKAVKHTNIFSAIFVFFILSLFISAPVVSAATTYDICTVTLEETNSGNVELTWNAIDGAETYEIYRAQNESTLFKEQNETNYNKIAMTQDTSYLDESIPHKDTKYTYYVLPLDETGAANWGYEAATISVHSLSSHIGQLLASMLFCGVAIAILIIALVRFKRVREYA